MTKKIIMIIDVEEDKLFTTVNDLYDRMQGYNTRLINVPQKKDIESLKRSNGTLSSRAWYREYLGYNKCLNEILGGNDD